MHTNYFFYGLRFWRQDNKEINEAKVPKPLNEYGKAKLEGENNFNPNEKPL